jgi:hypothetical protein
MGVTAPQHLGVAPPLPVETVAVPPPAVSKAP